MSHRWLAPFVAIFHLTPTLVLTITWPLPAGACVRQDVWRRLQPDMPAPGLDPNPPKPPNYPNPPPTTPTPPPPPDRLNPSTPPTPHPQVCREAPYVAYHVVCGNCKKPWIHPEIEPYDEGMEEINEAVAAIVLDRERLLASRALLKTMLEVGPYMAPI